MEFNDIVIRIVVAVLLGAIVGAEREYHNKSAGFRTMIMIALGSALFTVLSLQIYEEYPVVSDPTRIISYIVSGIGFLGAGAILKEGVSIRGMTTAASVWLVAALGIGAGAGEFEVIFLGAVAALVALLFLPFIESGFAHRNETVTYTLHARNKADLRTVERAVAQSGLKVLSTHWRKQNSKELVLRIVTQGSTQHHSSLSQQLTQMNEVMELH